MTSSPSPSLPRWAFPALAALSLLLSALFAWMVPAGENPDENAHRDYVRLLIEKKGPVVFVPPPGREPLPDTIREKQRAAEGFDVLPEGALSRDEVHQPPLYYLLAALVWGASGGSLIATRLLAALFQLVAVWLTLRAGRDLFPNRPEVAVGAAAFATVLPTQAQLGGALSNDALTHLLCVGLVWGALRWALRGVTIREAMLLGVVFGLGLWTKLSVLQLTPLLIVAAGGAVLRKRMPLGRAAGLMGLTLGLGVLIAAPWLLRNLSLYGDPLALNIYTATGPNFKPDDIAQMAGWSRGDYLRNVGVRSFASFFYFLHPNLPLKQFAGAPGPLLLALSVALLGGLGIWRAAKAEKVTAEERVTLGLAALAPILLTPFYLKFVLTVFQAQGRYFLPALLGVALVEGYGAAALTGGRRWLGALLPAALLLILTFAQLLNGGFVVLPPPR